VIHDTTPPFLREVVPGEYVVVNIERGNPLSRRAEFREAEFDFVYTIGFDFADLHESEQTLIRWTMKPDAAILRLSRA
jgi:hypothetical protein